MQTQSHLSKGSVGTSNRLKSIVAFGAQGGTSLIECLIAVSILGLGLGGVMTFNAQQLRTVRSTHEVSSANLSLQERIEQMRIGSWKQMTDATYIRDTFFATRPASSSPISSIVEEMTVTAYPDETTATPLRVRRNGNGTIQILSSGNGLSTKRSAKALLAMTWTGKDGRIRSLETIAVLSNGGLSRMTLPAFGQVASGTSTTTTTSPTPTPAPTPTPTPLPTPTPTPLPTPTPTPLPTPVPTPLPPGTNPTPTPTPRPTPTPTPLPTPTPTPLPTPTPTPLPTPTPTPRGNGNGRGTVASPNGKA